MAKKKKDKDFQKVKIKVGRKLKKQNETTVDLITKKIKLPRERDTEKSASEKDPRDLFDEAVASLDLEKSSAQLQAIQTLNRILDPFVRQLTSLTGPDSSGLTLSSVAQLNQAVAIHRALFQHTGSQSDLSIQLGTLISALNRLCRAAQDPRLGPGLVRLCTNLLKLLSIHPKFIGLLSVLDGCAIALLQRPESTWKWIGCQVAGLVLQSHFQLVSASTTRTELCNVFDASEQLVRSSIYTRVLVRLNEDLREKQSVNNVSIQRTSLLQTALAFLKDHQYTMRCTLGNSTLHPWLLSRPQLLFGLEKLSTGSSVVSLTFPLEGYSLHSVLQTPSERFISLDLSLIEMESSVLLRRHQRVQTSHHREIADKKIRAESLSARSDSCGNRPLWFDQAVREQRLLVSLLEHGIDILGELSIGIKDALLEDLYCVIRVLRVFLESKPAGFLRHGKVTQGGHKDISVFGTVTRFCQKLFSQLPIRPGEIGTDVVNTITHSRPSTDQLALDLPLPPAPPPGSTRQEIRRWHKRVAKLRNRSQKRQQVQTTASNTDGDDEDEATTKEPKTDSADVSNVETARTVSIESASSSATHATRRSISNHPPMFHRINQSLLDLLTLLELSQLTPPSVESDAARQPCWPPPDEFRERFAHYLLDDLFPPGTIWPLPTILAWLRCFDRYLLAHTRHPYRLRPVVSSQRLLAAPIITILGRLINGYSRMSEQSGVQAHAPLTRGQHRLYARVAGLLTAVLSMDLIQSRLQEQPTTESDEASSISYVSGVEYDEEWIKRTLVEQFHVTSSLSTQSIYGSLVQLLTQLVRDEPPRVMFVPSLANSTRHALGDQLEQIPTRIDSPMLLPVHVIDDTWAQCLVRLCQCRFAPVLRLQATYPDIQARLTKAERRLDRCDSLCQLAGQYEFPVAAGIATANQLGWIVSGYLPSLDGRYASPYFWQTARDNV